MHDDIMMCALFWGRYELHTSALTASEGNLCLVHMHMVIFQNAAFLCVLTFHPHTSAAGNGAFGKLPPG